jgi:hypothetical protein
MWDLWWTRWNWGRFSPHTSVSSTNSHSIDCSTLIIIYSVSPLPKKLKKKKTLSTKHNSCNKTFSTQMRIKHPSSCHSVQLYCLTNGKVPEVQTKLLAPCGGGNSCCEVHPSLSTDDFHILRKPLLALTFTAAPITVPVM